MNEEVMIDLETLGTGNDAVILSLGAVKFDPHSMEMGEKFYVTIDPASCQRYGMKIDAKTVLWWMGAERSEARDFLINAELLDLAAALEGFRLWMNGDKPVWGNGATFDNVILRNAFAAIGMECPWKFWNDRCYRTMKNVAPKMAVDTPIERIGTHHNALDDAVTQARHLQRIFAAHILDGAQ